MAGVEGRGFPAQWSLHPLLHSSVLVSRVMEEGAVERVRVLWRNETSPSPALRDGDAIAWNYVSPETDTAGRSYLLLDVGVKMTIPPVWIQRGHAHWYVDLAIVEQTGDLYRMHDFDIDLIVPMDGAPYRTLDLDEFADAVAMGEFTVEQALDGLRRWQAFLDGYIHVMGPRDVHPGWKDFPPASIARLAALPLEAFEAP